jgi:hypothetical protein
MYKESGIEKEGQICQGCQGSSRGDEGKRGRGAGNYPNIILKTKLGLKR